MGNSESVDIPGGGSDGYHVLRVSRNFGFRNCQEIIPFNSGPCYLVCNEFRNIMYKFAKYQHFQVQENSPGAKAGLQPFFDFIVAINGVRLDKDDGTLKNILKTGIGMCTYY